MATRQTGRPVVCIGTIDWAFLRQAQQVVTEGLAADGSPVMFVENMGGRAPKLYDLGRVRHRVVNLLRQLVKAEHREAGVTVLSPAVLPFRWARRLNDAVLLPLIARRVRRLGFDRPIVWTFAPTPTALRLIQLLRPHCVVYHCMNRVRGYSHATPELVASEDRLVRSADLVIADAAVMYEEKRRENPHTRRIPPAVDFAAFAEGNGRKEPADLRGLPHPRLCFFGSLDARMDVALLERVASARPNWSVVLLGPERFPLGALKRHANIHFLGTKSHRELPAYLHAMDALIIPYLLNAFTEGVAPAKLFECLAVGRPVIATPIPELVPFSDAIWLAGAEDFPSAVEQALSGNAERRERGLNYARQNSWDAAIELAREYLVDALNRVDGRDTWRLI